MILGWFFYWSIALKIRWQTFSTWGLFSKHLGNNLNQKCYWKALQFYLKVIRFNISFVTPSNAETFLFFKSLNAFWTCLRLLYSLCLGFSFPSGWPISKLGVFYNKLCWSFDKLWIDGKFSILLRFCFSHFSEIVAVWNRHYLNGTYFPYFCEAPVQTFFLIFCICFCVFSFESETLISVIMIPT